MFNISASKIGRCLLFCYTFAYISSWGFFRQTEIVKGVDSDMFLHHLIAASPSSTDSLFWVYNKYFLCTLFDFQSWQAVVVVFLVGSLPYKACFSSIVDIPSYIQSLTWGCHLVLAGIALCSINCPRSYFVWVENVLWPISTLWWRCYELL